MKWPTESKNAALQQPRREPCLPLRLLPWPDPLFSTLCHESCPLFASCVRAQLEIVATPDLARLVLPAIADPQLRVPRLASLLLQAYSSQGAPSEKTLETILYSRGSRCRK